MNWPCGVDRDLIFEIGDFIAYKRLSIMWRKGI
jgi:hypothetical protein